MFRILGHSDENTVCECCGKKNLKSTVVLGDEFGERFYGSVCALRALGRTDTDAPAVKRLVAKAVAMQSMRVQLTAWIVKHWELREELAAGNKTPWLTWCRVNAQGCFAAGYATPLALWESVVREAGTQLQAL